MRELSRKLAEQLEGGVDGVLTRVVALRRTALIVLIGLLVTHALAFLAGIMVAR